MEISFEIAKLSQMFAVLGEQSRLAIVTFLMEGEASVGKITKNMAMSQSAVSHQLRILRDAKILKSTRRGRHVFYSINDSHVQNIIESGLKHMLH